MNNILLIAFTSYAGMGPYVSTIINSFNIYDPVYFFLIDNKKRYYKNNIRSELLTKCCIIEDTPSMFQEIKNLFISDSKLYIEINKFISDKNITLIHLLTSGTRIRGVLNKWKRQYNILLTIHDLLPHEANKAIHKEIKQKILYSYQDRMIKNIDNLLTNSDLQYKQLVKDYPNKSIFFHEFPTLMTPLIANGISTIPELEGVSNYILFFGRIEYYKGLHILYQAWCNNSCLNSNYTLVIAGAGDNYIKRNSNEKNIIFINRYIKDDEIRSLYENAIISVYPYISATQSGVVSLSCYFQVPILTSDIPFFKPISDNGIGLSFKNGIIEDLEHVLIRMLESDLSRFKKGEYKFYKENYNPEGLRNKLLSIYSEIYSKSLLK